ncbi:MAG: glycosyltransferase family 4 protein [Betaproteobacteria bacterium]|nr:glycosyltransferase family 4 protein [Betaproteobacteria bacterium]
MTSSHRPLSILHTESSTGWGGQEIRILTEARGMLDRGHRVMLLTPANAEILPAAQRMGVPVEAIDIERKRVGSLLKLRAWISRHGRDYDVVNTHSSTDSWLVAIASATLKHAPPLVRTRHVSTPINNKFSTRWLYRDATAHIVTTGESLRQQLHRDNGYALDRMTSVRTGIDLNRFLPLDKRAMRAKLGVEDAPTLGILATLRDWKGHQHLLEAFVVLRNTFPDWRLIIIGDGPERERLTASVEKLGLGDRVKLVGNQENVPEWLSTLDLFVLPSYGSEGVPQGIMQAMACGLPVVATPVGAVGEAVQDKQTGLMTEPRNPAALAATLATLMGDNTLRERMGAASLAYARANFGIDIMLDRMLDVFQRAAAGRGAASRA